MTPETSTSTYFFAHIITHLYVCCYNIVVLRVIMTGTANKEAASHINTAAWLALGQVCLKLKLKETR